jgi:putative MATE family efflux protein
MIFDLRALGSSDNAIALSTFIALYRILPMPPAAPNQGKFVTGSTLKHVLNMTVSGSVGLIAVFAVDLLNLFYISLLGQKELAAAVGYAGTLLFFVISISIGLAIAVSAVTSRALGQGDRDKARHLAGASLVLMVASMALSSALLYPLIGRLLGLLGATGLTAELALRFTHWVLPSAPLLGAGMCVSALLRALGDGKRAMYVTLSAAAAVAVLDPLFIFGFGWGLDGAALATGVARVVMVCVGLYGLVRIHKLLARPTKAELMDTCRPFFAIGLPSILTQVATPVGNALVTAAIAPFGDSAIAGWAIVGRVIPVAFAALYGLSGAVGPIIGQNLGAGRYDRLRSTMMDSLKVVVVYVLVTWLVLVIFSGVIADAFGATGQAREVIVFFCQFVAGSFVFNGGVFVANAAFNNLGFVLYSTALNWGRATLGVVPFIWVGGQYFGLKGVLAGYALGVVLFGVVGVWGCFKVLGQMQRRAGLATAI